MKHDTRPKEATGEQVVAKKDESEVPSDIDARSKSVPPPSESSHRLGMPKFTSSKSNSPSASTRPVSMSKQDKPLTLVQKAQEVKSRPKWGGIEVQPARHDDANTAFLDSLQDPNQMEGRRLGATELPRTPSKDGTAESTVADSTDDRTSAPELRYCSPNAARSASTTRRSKVAGLSQRIIDTSVQAGNAKEREPAIVRTVSGKKILLQETGNVSPEQTREVLEREATHVPKDLDESASKDSAATVFPRERFNQTSEANPVSNSYRTHPAKEKDYTHPVFLEKRSSAPREDLETSNSQSTSGEPTPTRFELAGEYAGDADEASSRLATLHPSTATSGVSEAAGTAQNEGQRVPEVPKKDTEGVKPNGKTKTGRRRRTRTGRQVSDKKSVPDSPF